MKIAVAIKQVPARDSVLRVAGKWIDDADLQFEINEPDAYALEAALQLKELHGGEVIVVSVGPARVATALREALAKGADRGVHLLADGTESLDVLGIATLLRQALAQEQPDLILTGLQSDDLGSGQTGVVLAELLGAPHATIIMAVEVLDGSIRVKRELENGWYQHLELPLPAVLTIQSGINKLRYATLMGIKKAKTKEIVTLTGITAPAALVKCSSVYLPNRFKQTQILEGDAESAARQLAEKLKFEVRAI